MDELDSFAFRRAQWMLENQIHSVMDLISFWILLGDPELWIVL